MQHLLLHSRKCVKVCCMQKFVQACQQLSYSDCAVIKTTFWSECGYKVEDFQVFTGNVHTWNKNGSWADPVKCGNLNIWPIKDTFL